MLHRTQHSEDEVHTAFTSPGQRRALGREAGGAPCRRSGEEASFDGQPWRHGQPGRQEAPVQQSLQRLFGSRSSSITAGGKRSTGALAPGTNGPGRGRKPTASLAQPASPAPAPRPRALLAHVLLKACLYSKSLWTQTDTILFLFSFFLSFLFFLILTPGYVY